jgi:hypothetical protein
MWPGLREFMTKSGKRFCVSELVVSSRRARAGKLTAAFTGDLM